LAASLFDAVSAGRVTAYAPTLILYELPRALHRAIRRDRITLEWALDSEERFRQLGVQIVDDRSLSAAAIRLAEQYRCNYYDACYMALADLLGLPFVFADDKLERQLADRVRYALPLSRLDLG
jgi:predicted nucleic acid-binding protein